MIMKIEDIKEFKKICEEVSATFAEKIMALISVAVQFAQIESRSQRIRLAQLLVSNQNQLYQELAENAALKESLLAALGENSEALTIFKIFTEEKLAPGSLYGVSGVAHTVKVVAFARTLAMVYSLNPNCLFTNAPAEVIAGVVPPSLTK